MDSESEFPFPSSKDKEIIKHYYNIENEFKATSVYLFSDRIVNIRKFAVAVIAKFSPSIDRDTYIPYLAMNYFDRFFSRHRKMLEDVEGRNDAEKVTLIAVSCLTISAKMRTDNFSLDDFLIKLFTNMYVRINHRMIMRMELLILDELNWAMRSVTPFCFLNNYYPIFKNIGGFKRRCINEILVLAQGVHNFTHYRHSVMAFAAFLTATKIAYTSEYKRLADSSTSITLGREDLADIVDELVKRCDAANIKIEPADSGILSSSSKVVAVPRVETKEVGTLKINKMQQSSAKVVAVVLDLSEEGLEEEDGTALIPRRRRVTGKTEAFQGQAPVQVEDLNDDVEKTVAVGEIREEQQQLTSGNEIKVPEVDIKEKEPQQELASGNEIIVAVPQVETKEVRKSKIKEIQQSKSEAVVTVDLSEEGEEEDNGTVLITRRRGDTGKTETSQVQALVQVEDLSDDVKKDVPPVVEIEEEEQQLELASGNEIKVPEGEIKEKEQKQELARGNENETTVAETSDNKDAAAEEIEAERIRLAKGKRKEVDEVTEVKEMGLDLSHDPEIFADMDNQERIETIIRLAADKGKAAVRQPEIQELEVPKNLMNFELKWPTDIPSLEAAVIEGAQPGQSKIVGVNIAGTVKKVNCGSCNVS